MEYNFCPSCGEKLDQNYNFCPSCGNDLTTEPGSSKKSVKTGSPAKTNNSSFLIILLSIVFALVVIFLVLKSNQKPARPDIAESGQTNGDQPTPQMNQMMQSVLETKKALEKDPHNYDLNVQMGNNAFDIGRFQLAVKYYRTAVSVKQTDPNVLIDLGVAYFNLNVADSALYFMESALKIDPNHPQGLYNAGIVHFNLGDTTQAVKYWKKLISVNKDLPQAKAAQKFIDQLQISK